MVLGRFENNLHISIHHFAKFAHVKNKGEMSKMSDFPQATLTPSIEPRNGE
jgi:hypothetical protein